MSDSTEKQKPAPAAAPEPAATAEPAAEQTAPPPPSEAAQQPPEHPNEPTAEREPEVGEVHLMYKIEGQPNEVPVFELARTLEAMGNIIQEGDQVLNADKHQVVVRVKPFQEGSFLMDFVLSVQNNPLVLFFISQPEAIERIKKVLEYLGLIKKGKEAIATVLEVIDFLENGKPKRVEPAGPDKFNYYNQQDQVMPVTQPIHNLVNNGTIQQFIFPAVGAPLERDRVEAIKTFLKNDEANTAVQIPKAEAPALKAYSEPEPEPPKEEVLENTTTEFLNPKAGTYGDIEGTWIFTKAGTKKNPFRARITHEKFLAKYGRGSIRFYHDDVLKAKVKSEQRLKNGRSTTTYEIIEVLDYTKAPVQRTGRNGRNR